MIVKGASLEQLLKRPASALRAVLFYGPNEGRVREHAQRVTQAIVADIHDPFRIANLTGAALKEDPALLADEAAAIAMTGGRRVIRLSGAGDALLPAFLNFLQDPKGDSLIVMEAGALTKTSKLRKTFEDSPLCAIAACYEDSAADLSAMVTDHLAQNGLRITSDAKDYLLQCLGEDRMASRQELDKLVLYKGFWTHRQNSKDIREVMAGAGSQDIRDIPGVADVPDTIDSHDGADIQAIADSRGTTGTIGIIDGTDIHDALAVADVLAPPEIRGIKDTGGIMDAHDRSDGHDSFDGKDRMDIHDIQATYAVADTSDTSDSHDLRDGMVTKDNLVRLQDVQACIGDGAVHSLDEICDCLCLGDPKALDAHIQRAFAGGVSPITILRTLSTQLMKLQLVLAAQAKGSSADMALRVLRPPLHFSRITAFRRMLPLWNTQLAAHALEQVLRTEAACKTTGAPDFSLCSQALLQLAHLPRRARTAPPAGLS